MLPKLAYLTLCRSIQLLALLGRTHRPHRRLGVGSVRGAARDGVGARYSVTSGDLRILMDQPTEAISSHDASSR
jgi:hypothetical protein